MATVIPPPPKKKAKLEKLNANTLNDAVLPSFPNIIVQLKDGRTGKPIGSSISLPSNTDKRGLELLVNQLKKDQRAKKPKLSHQERKQLAEEENDDRQDDDDDEADVNLPWSFSLTLRRPQPPKLPSGPEVLSPEEEEIRIPIYESLSKDLLINHSNLISSEDILVIDCEPEAIFRVREVRRCSSSLAGMTTKLVFSSKFYI
jgi:ribosome assembly protein 4